MSYSISLKSVGGFKDKLGTDIEPLPSIVVDANSAGVRLVALKQKFNELQDKRKSLHKRQGIVAGASVAKGGKAGVLGGTISGIHQRNRITEVIEEMEECIDQINTLRAAFGSIPGWLTAEAQCKINEKSFDKKVIDRKTLKGGL